MVDAELRHFQLVERVVSISGHPNLRVADRSLSFASENTPTPKPKIATIRVLELAKRHHPSGLPRG